MADDTDYGNDVCASVNRTFSGIYSSHNGVSALLKTITDTLPLGFYVVDARSEKIVYFNDRFCEIWGLGHLKERMKDGTLDNRDIAPEIVRMIASVNTPPITGDMPERGSTGATTDELFLNDGRVIRRFSACISYGKGSRAGSFYAFEDFTAQADAQEKIKKSNERYKELADALPQIVFETDLQGNITFSNKSAFTVTGYTPEDFDNGLNAIGMIVPEDRIRALDNMEGVLKGNPTGNEYTIVRRDGSLMPVIINSTPIYREGRAVGFRGIIVDITECKTAEEQIKASLREKEALLTEIRLRVRNNLQLISSLLSLQMAYANDLDAVSLLKESQSRIRTIAIVLEDLYEGSDLATVDFKGYLKKLCTHLASTRGIAQGKVKMVIEGDDIRMEPDMVVPCGLIMSELMAGSLKRAFASGRPDEIHIGLHNGEHITITYVENCPIQHERASGNDADKLSWQLVKALAEQLDGTFGYDTVRNALIIDIPAGKKPGSSQDRPRQI